MAQAQSTCREPSGTETLPVSDTSGPARLAGPTCCWEESIILILAEQAAAHIVRRRRIRARLHGPTGAPLRQAAYFLGVIEHLLQRHRGFDDPELAASVHLVNLRPPR